MSTVAASRRGKALPERSVEWRERAGRLHGQLRRPAQAMLRRAFRGAFDDDEIEDVYSSAWLGTLRALERRHEQLSDEEIRKYVLTAVANHASKELRRRSRRPTAPLEAVHAIADDRTLPDERAAKLEESRVTRDLLVTLPPRRRAVMLMRYGWGLEPRQICGLVKGLSPRAYRKEITRGVDELAEKLRLLERGQWCADREPVLKAYAAGLADAEQQRQARQHLSHCRHCLEFVGKLSGHLHDVGSSLAVLGGVDAIATDGSRLRTGWAMRSIGCASRPAMPSQGSAGDGADRRRHSSREPAGRRPRRGSRGYGCPGKARRARHRRQARRGVHWRRARRRRPAWSPGSFRPTRGARGEDGSRTAPPWSALVSESPPAPVGTVPDPSSGDATQAPPPASGEEPAPDATSESPGSVPEPQPPIAPSTPPGAQEFGVASAAPDPVSAD